MTAFYYADWSSSCRKVKELVEASGLEVDFVDLSEHKRFEDFAGDFFRHGGPRMLPAIATADGIYEGLNQIKQYLAEQTRL
jgi:glutathione S-transferase